MHVVVCGRRRVRPTPGQALVLWIISHPELVDPASCEAADLVLVASDRFAARLRALVDTPVEVLHQATDHHRFTPAAGRGGRSGVVIVAKTRGERRPMVDNAIAAGLAPEIYGGGWASLVDPALVKADHVANADLPRVYAEAEVVLNDHWHWMREWGFVSNRLFDVMACGTPVVSDPIDGLEELFGTAIATAGGPRELRLAVDQIRNDPVSAAASAAQGRSMVLARHTFDHRGEPTRCVP